MTCSSVRTCWKVIVLFKRKSVWFLCILHVQRVRKRTEKMGSQRADPIRPDSDRSILKRAKKKTNKQNHVEDFKATLWYFIWDAGDGPVVGWFMNFRQDIQFSWPWVVRPAEVIVWFAIYYIIFRQGNKILKYFRFQWRFRGKLVGLT